MTMTPDEIRDAAERIIRSHTKDIESLSVWEMTEGDEPTDDDIDAIQNLIRSATVTVTWPGQNPIDQVVRRLVGTDEQPGILDDFTVLALPARDGTDKPLIVWRCDNGCGNGHGHAGIIARDLDGDQSGLTVGEIAESALRHRAEDHPEAPGLDAPMRGDR